MRELFIGLDKSVPILGGNKVVPINFDNAATTPVFRSVLKKIVEYSEDYGSIGRGLGQKSEFSTKIYNDCRSFILDFFKAPSNKYTAIFVNNTTDGINKLSNILITSKDDVVITSRMEHHSNDLPWRGKCILDYIEVDNEGRLKLEELEEKLIKHKDNVKFVSLIAASNVTGYVNDLVKIAKIVHKYKAKLIVDGAQIVAHKRIYMTSDVEDENIDFLVFSAHKIYAPFGSGAIVGLKSYFNNANPDIKGGGTVEAVLDYSEIWLNTPERNEAGSPNFFGAVALVEAIKELERIGYDNIEKNEKLLLAEILEGIKKIPNVINYGDIEDYNDRLGIIVFNIEGMYDCEVAKKLAELKAIAVRQGAFCAHPYIKRLLNLSDEEATEYLRNSECRMPGMVRVSFGIYNTIEEINVFLNIVEWMSKNKI